MATIRLLSEQVMLRLKGGRIDQANRRDIREIDAAVRQAVSERYSGSYLNVTLPSGETIPEGMLLATFEDVPVEDWKDRSRAELPVMPVSLPRGMGVFEVSDPDDPNKVFIPALPGQAQMVREQHFLSAAIDTIIYMPYGKYIEFDELLDIDTVMIREVVSDPSRVDLYETLAMPSDWEAVIIDTVYKRFAPMLPTDNKTDVVTENSGR